MLKILLSLVLFAFTLPSFAHKDPQIAGYIDVEGGRIWYRINGIEHLNKKPALLVLHGGPGSGHRGNMPFVELANEYPVILYDQLDAGNADRPNKPANWRVNRFVDEIGYIREHLKLKELVIAGHSWGGTLAAEYAVTSPKGLRGVILSSPLINTKQWISDNKHWITQLPEQSRKAIELHEAKGTTEHPDYLAANEVFNSRHMCRKSPCPSVAYKAGGPSFNSQVYNAMWGPTEFYANGTLKDYDISERLSTIAAPTLMICGEFDEAVPSSCKKYAQLIDGAQNVVVPNAGHATMADNEQFYLDSIRQFLTKVIE